MTHPIHTFHGGAKMKKILISAFLLLVLGVAVLHFVPNTETGITGELGVEEDIVINAQAPNVNNTIPYYKVIKEERIDKSEPNIITPKKLIPSKDEAKNISNQYLQDNGYMPEDAHISDIQTLYMKTINTSTGENIIESKEPVLVEVSYNRRLGNLPVVGPGDTITVSLGENGKVIYFFKSWRDLEPAGRIKIIDANTAIKNLQKGKIIRKSAGIDNPMTEINEMKIGFFSDNSGKEQAFYKPVWIFRGTDSHGNNVTKYVDGVTE
jgi:hypothetical protein